MLLNSHNRHAHGPFIGLRRMKWVKASHGRIPDGYSPVQGGYEDSGQQLYHALAKIEGHWVPGKTGLHLLGGNFPYHHQEIRMVSRESRPSPSELADIAPCIHRFKDIECYAGRSSS